ncbi:MAG: hypothetical protein INF91_05385 [Alphaproteobacteria bacterium]|nr:hypothetical protein [Alphaproteobacteria bacterium]
MTMTEGRAMMLAGGAHLALLAGLSLSWSMTAKTLPQVVEAVPVEIVEISDMARVTEPPKPSMEAAPQETVEATAPTPAPDEAAAPPAPKPAPKTASDMPAPNAKAEPPKPADKAKDKAADAAKKAGPQRLDSQQLASLLDKKLPKAERKPLNTSALATSLEKSIPRGAQLDARATATLEQAIRSQVAPCWNPPIGGAEVGRMTVQLRIQMAKDGRVLGTPQIIGQTGVTAANSTFAKAFAESARRAVLRCSPLTLPPDLYDAWKLFELNFDPRQML